MRKREEERRRADARAAEAAVARASRGRTDDCSRLFARLVRYFLDTEYNGIGGELLSLALVPDDGQELYLTLEWSTPLLDWVERNVIPYLDQVPAGSCSVRASRRHAARRA